MSADMPLARTTFAGLAFRMTSPRYSDLHRTAVRSREFPGRFNTTAVGAVYISREPETAVEEFRRRAARDGIALTDMHPRSIFVIDLYLHEVVDLTRPGQLAAWGLTHQDLSSNDMERCQEAAAVAAQLGAEAIRWASATGAGQSLAVFVDSLLPGSHAEIIRSVDLTREMLGAIEKGTSVRTIVPSLDDIPFAP
jgi:RES domain-containing protein